MVTQPYFGDKFGLEDSARRAADPTRSPRRDGCGHTADRHRSYQEQARIQESCPQAEVWMEIVPIHDTPADLRVFHQCDSQAPVEGLLAAPDPQKCRYQALH
ncbi:hypothetical protein KNU62_gp86 [Gordonia phage Bakery]|uniref:Uncharacterized protein n=1 Tax=Gordonia phage Bakery TaxID=2591205 RepID=A0A514DGY9_9CAUD|nr:hypothetical protein KNU62_gp86 [Gordonia phage Bakery]QDH92881.1 hypothetical protein SEA_BAKERY_86 [Gordonia phage Bakery]